jgi:predicted RNA binding protein YcfA (HicA-like mRNA interferase family)
MPPRDFDLDIRAIRRRLEREGWFVKKSSGEHDIYRHREKYGRIPVPRGRGDLPPGTARNIAVMAGWIGSKDRST